MSNVSQLKTGLTEAHRRSAHTADRLSVFQARLLSALWVRQANKGPFMRMVEIMRCQFRIGLVGESHEWLIPYSETDDDLLWYDHQIRDLAGMGLITLLPEDEVSLSPLGEEIGSSAWPEAQLSMTDDLDYLETDDAEYLSNRRFPPGLPTEI
ncbi:MAG TPA: hypothetical protein ENK35_02280 [Candidatus Tenderia sp.]|nr:hypothetical protein [Candidatus Tenderia sp.]